MYIYETVNNINGKKYIGSKKADVESSKSYYGSGKLLKLALKKYGTSNFTKTILWETDCYELLKEYEINLLTKTKASEDPNYYNLHDNFSGGYNASAYTKESRTKIGKKNSQRVLSKYQKSCTWMNTPEVNLKKFPFDECNVCGHIGRKVDIYRWHNENCKLAKTNDLS